jgi:hypothetical protein
MHIVRAEICFTCEVESRGQLRPSTVEAAFDGANRHLDHLRSFLIGQTLCSDHEQRLSLIQRERRQGCAEVLEVETALLIRVRLEPRGIRLVRILDLAFALAVLGVELIAQDREEPCVEVSAALEPVDVSPRS